MRISIVLCVRNAAHVGLRNKINDFICVAALGTCAQGDFELESWRLPSVMRPYIDRLAGLRMILEGDQLDLARRSLYAEITWDALSRMTLPVLLLLDDVHELDEDSAAVMVAVVERGCSGPQRSAAPYRAHAADQPNNAIIMSSQRPITRQSMDDNGQPTCHPLQELPGVLLLKLSPLQDRDVEALACLTLECSSLAPPIRDAILRESSCARYLPPINTVNE